MGEACPDDGVGTLAVADFFLKVFFEVRTKWPLASFEAPFQALHSFINKFAYLTSEQIIHEIQRVLNLMGNSLR